MQLPVVGLLSPKPLSITNLLKCLFQSFGVFRRKKNTHSYSQRITAAHIHRNPHISTDTNYRLTLVGSLVRVPGGYPQVGGWKIIAAAYSNTSLRSILKSKKFETKSRRMPPPHGVLDHRSPLLYFFLLLYYLVSLYIFTVFLHFFLIIEGRAVVIQPPQL